jgi:hypothetical protein
MVAFQARTGPKNLGQVRSDYAHFHDVAADNFDPQVINRAALNDALNALAGKWRRNPRKT